MAERFADLRGELLANTASASPPRVRIESGGNATITMFVHDRLDVAARTLAEVRRALMDSPSRRRSRVS